MFEAKDGAHALLQMQRMVPDLVITDLNMPVMSGTELIKKIKENPQYKQIKIIALSSYNQKTTVLEAFKAGADDYIVKPFDMEKLESRIIRLLEK